VAPKIGEKGKMTYPRGEGGSTGVIPAGNIAGHPALCVPTGLGEEGLPTSLQFVGPAWSEGLMLAVGAEYQGTACTDAAGARRLQGATWLRGVGRGECQGLGRRATGPGSGCRG
jgi:Asp-tRNA(Asn)/Glu-tRNA(Gln) amidotransferase A subunit family amidase